MSHRCWNSCKAPRPKAPFVVAWFVVCCCCGCLGCLLSLSNPLYFGRSFVCYQGLCLEERWVYAICLLFPSCFGIFSKMCLLPKTGSHKLGKCITGPLCQKRLFSKSCFGDGPRIQNLWPPWCGKEKMHANGFCWTSPEQTGSVPWRSCAWVKFEWPENNLASAPSAAHIFHKNGILPQFYSKNGRKKGESDLTPLFTPSFFCLPIPGENAQFREKPLVFSINFDQPRRAPSLY